MPHVLAVYKEFNAGGFEIVGVNYEKDWKRADKAKDESKDEFKPFIETMGLLWRQVRDTESTIITAHNIKGFPTMILISPEGKVITRDASGDSLDRILRVLTKWKQPEAKADSKAVATEPAKAPEAKPAAEPAKKPDAKPMKKK